METMSLELKMGIFFSCVFFSSCHQYFWRMFYGMKHLGTKLSKTWFLFFSWSSCGGRGRFIGQSTPSCSRPISGRRGGQCIEEGVFDVWGSWRSSWRYIGNEFTKYKKARVECGIVEETSQTMRTSCASVWNCERLWSLSPSPPTPKLSAHRKLFSLKYNC